MAAKSVRRPSHTSGGSSSPSGWQRHGGRSGGASCGNSTRNCPAGSWLGSLTSRSLGPTPRASTHFPALWTYAGGSSPSSNVTGTCGDNGVGFSSAAPSSSHCWNRRPVSISTQAAQGRRTKRWLPPAPSPGARRRRWTSCKRDSSAAWMSFWRAFCPVPPAKDAARRATSAGCRASTAKMAKEPQRAHWKTKPTSVASDIAAHPRTPRRVAPWGLLSADSA
mmetsp:Transcript_106716/g.339843  ORF Transcript_106716/g.339843 Transcript_106716/m.339843 type:complete len:222 (-) Transcript_106716:1-666(-)